MFAIASSGVAAQKIGPAQEQYNSLSRRARTLLELWNGSQTPQRSLSDALEASATAEEQMRALIRRHGESTGELERRLDQFIREDRRVSEALEAVRAVDRSRLGELADASQADAERLLGNQVPETIALARAARELGAFAASSFGAGFGGSVWALVDRDGADGFAGRWLSDYQSRYQAGTTATTFLARPGPPLTRLL
jgi:galactokinase